MRRASARCRNCWRWTVKACTGCGIQCGATGCTTGCVGTIPATMARLCRAMCRSHWALQGIWKQRPDGPEHQKIFFVGVTLRNLTPDAQVPQRLFEEPGHRAELSATMDKLNLKFGHTTVHFAGMLPARDSAPTRIAFTQIPVQYGVEYM